MRQLSEAVAKVTSKNFSRKYIAIGRIVEEWDNILGSDLADKAQPVKINYRKHKRAKTPRAILDIATTAANATTLHYQKDLILERINRIFGEGWITDIRFVTVAPETKKKRLKKPKQPLTQEEKAFLSDILSGIEDTELKQRLEKLGQGILKRKE